MLSSFLYRWGNRGSQASNNLPRLGSTKAKSCLVLNPSCMMGWLFIFQEEDNGIRVLNAGFYLCVCVHKFTPCVWLLRSLKRGSSFLELELQVVFELLDLDAGNQTRSSWRETSIRNLLNSLSSPDNRMFSHLQSPPSPRFCSKKKKKWRKGSMEME